MENDSFRENNFKRLKETDPERQRQIARAGGLKSGEVRKKKRAQTDYMRKLLDVSFYYMEGMTPEEVTAFRRWRKRQKKKKKKNVSKNVSKRDL